MVIAKMTLKMIDQFQIITSLFGHKRVVPMNRLSACARAYRSHSRILKALENRDSNAAESLMHQHLHLAKEEIMAEDGDKEILDRLPDDEWWALLRASIRPVEHEGEQ